MKHRKKTRYEKTRITSISKKTSPMVVRGVRALGSVVVSVDELDELNIDDDYQRREIRREVNELIAALKAGGIIPDPISLAIRKDGTRWIVDGQQRYWAYWNCELPLQAQLYEVDDIDAERGLFSVLNRQVRLNTHTRVMAWPGSGGGTMRWLNVSPHSPLRTEITQAGGGKYLAAVIARGLLGAMGGGVEGGGVSQASIDRVMLSLDHAVDRAPTRALKVATTYALILRDVFNAKPRIRLVQAAVIGVLCGKHWTDLKSADIFPRPEGRALRSLRVFNWDAAAPTSALKWLDAIVATLIKRWPVAR